MDLRRILIVTSHTASSSGSVVVDLGQTLGAEQLTQTGRRRLAGIGAVCLKSNNKA
jgi:hypothetical protein